MSGVWYIARLFARPLLIAFLLLVPVAVLAGLGVLWLVQNGYWESMVVGSVILALITWRVAKIPRSSAPLPVIPRGSAIDQLARDRVETIAAEAIGRPPTDINDYKRVFERVFDEVSKSFHPETRMSILEFTVPEVLLAIHDVSGRLRERILAEVPGSDVVTVRDVKRIYDIYRNYGWVLEVLPHVGGVLRLVSNPLTAVAQSFRGILSEQATSELSKAALNRILRIFIQELGEIAIDLYAGRYRNKAIDAIERVREEAPAVERLIPIRLLIAGQVNSGKSSLTNALLGAVKASVSELPSLEGTREFRIDAQSLFDLIVCDSVGIASDSSSKAKQDLVDAAGQADLIIWVSRATQPARSIDLEILRKLRSSFAANLKLRPPPILLVLSHIDQLSPATEWAPPYDLTRNDRLKAISIRDAVDFVSRTLEFSDSAIPMSLRTNAAYNLDALWGAIESCADDARMTALDRALRASPLSASRVIGQIARGTSTVIQKALLSSRS